STSPRCALKVTPRSTSFAPYLMCKSRTSIAIGLADADLAGMLFVSFISPLSALRENDGCVAGISAPACRRNTRPVAREKHTTRKLESTFRRDCPLARSAPRCPGERCVLGGPGRAPGPLVVGGSVIGGDAHI